VLKIRSLKIAESDIGTLPLTASELSPIKEAFSDECALKLPSR